jgi:two-component system CheB/CheR fusion protein
MQLWRHVSCNVDSSGVKGELRKEDMQDNGQAQQIETGRRTSDLAFRRMVEKLPAAAYTTDAEGLITYFNQRAVELWGREPKLNDPMDRY